VIVVDSSVWIDFFNGVATPEVERLDVLLGVSPVAVGDLILVEVLQGFRNDRDLATARQLFRSMPLLAMLGLQNAYKAAEHYRSLRSRGITVRETIDGIIATACIEAHLPLLFSDRDFLPYVEHLGLEAAWAAMCAAAPSPAVACRWAW
jgi:predicted nucleic acid-binding protein